MNPIKDAVAGSELAWTSGVMTAAFLLFFVGWAVWAWWPGNRASLDAAARLPFDDGEIQLACPSTLPWATATTTMALRSTTPRMTLASTGSLSHAVTAIATNNT